jgi:hypothetical protein
MKSLQGFINLTRIHNLFEANILPSLTVIACAKRAEKLLLQRHHPLSDQLARLNLEPISFTAEPSKYALEDSLRPTVRAGVGKAGGLGPLHLVVQQITTVGTSPAATAR